LELRLRVIEWCLKFADKKKPTAPNENGSVGFSKEISLVETIDR
jgi:hypothetical protein